MASGGGKKKGSGVGARRVKGRQFAPHPTVEGTLKIQSQNLLLNAKEGKTTKKKSGDDSGLKSMTLKRSRAKEAVTDKGKNVSQLPGGGWWEEN